MSTNKTNSTPLWRVLNERRTPGKWQNNGQELIAIDDDNYNLCRFSAYPPISGNEQEAKANAQYTALAVNNLHKLAEALTRIREASVQGLEMYANGEKFSFETLAGFVAEISGEALTAIS